MAEHWIQGAIKHKGALRRLAAKENALNEDGSIDRKWLSEAAKRKGATGRRARLAITLSKLNK